MNATTWGHRFESITRRIYELELAGLDTVNDTLGRFTHATTPWLSASPDGLVTKGPLTGRLVEIKSPKTRQPGEFVPVEYYVQMQIQMEVCNLDAVDFVEAQFKQRHLHSLTCSDQDALDHAQWKGAIQVRGYMEDSSTWRYRYSEPVEEISEMIFREDPELEGLPLLEHSVWWLTGFYPRTVLRSADWWNTIGWPNAQLFWAEVLSLRDLHTVKSVTVEKLDDGWIGHA
jgi:hypothetical protein